MEAAVEAPIDKYIRLADKLVAADFAPLSDEEKAHIRSELSRIPEFVQGVTRIRGRDVDWSTLDHRYPELPSALWHRIMKTRWGKEPIEMSWSHRTLKLPGIDPEVEVRDLASYIYRESIVRNIRTPLFDWEIKFTRPPLPPAFEDLVRSLLLEVEWSEAASPETLRRQREQWIRSLEFREGEWYQGVVEVRVGDRLYGDAHRPDDPTGSEVDHHNLDWRAIALDFDHARDPDLNAQVERTLQRLKEEIRKRVEAQAGLAAPATREANDRFDVQRGLLTPDCASWTYPELEYWTRAATRNVSSRVVHDWLRRYGPGFDVHFTLEVAPEEVDVESFAEVADDLVRVASKRVLCDLLTVSELTPAVYGRESFVWYDVEFLDGYLEEAGVALLEQEIRAEREVLTIRSAIARNLVQQRIAGFRGEIAYFAPTLLLDEIGTITSPKPHWLALIGLSGQTLISPVPLPTPTHIPPIRVLIERGDVLLIPERYETVVLRAHEGASRLLIIEYQLEH